MGKYVCSIDQGTTSTRAILFDKNGNKCFVAQREVSMSYPHPGWVEQDALEIYVSVIDVINEVVVKSNISFQDIDCIGITNQRETTVVWEKSTGLPIYPAIVWQSKQSQTICEEKKKYESEIHRKTGLRLNPYFSASKLRFILDVTHRQQDAEDGKLLFGTIDSWLIYKLTGGKVHATDITNASRTMLFHIQKRDWDEELLQIFQIPRVMLPQVRPCSYHYGDATFFGTDIKIPITGVAGDQQASLFGQTCFHAGDLKNTYGTGCFMLMNTGETPVYSKNGLLTTIAWEIPGEVNYALEGSVFMGGACVQWLRDQLKVISTAAETEEAAKEVKDSDGVYIIPAFAGLGTPYWDDDARGAIFGMTRGTTKNHIIRAVLEAIAYQSKDVIEVMKKESGLSLQSLSVDGGATANGYLMQFQADILHTNILLPTCLETTALGAAYFAGLTTGFYDSKEQLSHIHQAEKTYVPSMKKKEIAERYKKWKVAVKATRMFK